jgi:putative hydrolase
MIAQLKRAAEEIRAGADWRGTQGILLLMTDRQRALFAKMQAMMALLEGHASFVMNRVAADRVTDLDRMRRSLKERRRATGMEKGFQRAIGFDSKIAQYDTGERFVRAVVDAVGMERFNRIWQDEEHLPTSEEIADPARWVGRVAGT